MLDNPRAVSIHPGLQELSAGGPDAFVGLEEALLRVNKRFGLIERRDVEVGQDVSQVLLRHGGTQDADGDAEYAGRFADKDALPVRPRGVIDRILENAGN